MADAAPLVRGAIVVVVVLVTREPALCGTVDDHDENDGDDNGDCESISKQNAVRIE